MKSRISRILHIAQQIALIKEEFSEREIFEAVKLLKELGFSSDILTYLSDSKTSKIASQASQQKKKSLEEQNSQKLIELEKNDPEKYQFLMNFDSFLRNADVLSDLNKIRRLGEHLNKEFSAKASRSYMVNQVIKLLTNYPLEEIKEIVQNTLHFDNSEDNAYQNLANFIITGHTNQDQTSE